MFLVRVLKEELFRAAVVELGMSSSSRGGGNVQHFWMKLKDCGHAIQREVARKKKNCCNVVQKSEQNSVWMGCGWNDDNGSAVVGEFSVGSLLSASQPRNLFEKYSKF